MKNKTGLEVHYNWSQRTREQVGAVPNNRSGLEYGLRNVTDYVRLRLPAGCKEMQPSRTNLSYHT